MKKITLTYNLPDDQIDNISYGCGYQDSITNIKEDGSWESTPNTKDRVEFITEYFTSLIDSNLSSIYTRKLEQEARASIEAQKEQITQLIQSQKEVSVDTI